MSGQAWIVGAFVGSIGVLGALAVGAGAACILVAPLGLVAGAVQRRWQRRAVRVALAPVLLRTQGELPEPPEPPEFPSAPRDRYGAD